METIFLHGRIIKYSIERKHGKRMQIIISHDETVKIIAPLDQTDNSIHKFMREKAKWIIRKVRSVKNLVPLDSIAETGHIANCKREVIDFVMEGLRHYNKFYHFSYNRVSIKNHSSRWGSCTIRKDLNFNYRILYLPRELADYIIVHELCHLQEMNHSKKFWDLVGKALPDYRERRKELKKIIFT